jgi:hypothetical protein
MLLDWQSTRLPLTVKWFMEMENTKDLGCLYAWIYRWCRKINI